MAFAFGMKEGIREFRRIAALRARLRFATPEQRELLMLELDAAADHPVFAATDDMIRSWAFPPPDVCARAGIPYVEPPPRLN